MISASKYVNIFLPYLHNWNHVRSGRGEGGAIGVGDLIVWCFLRKVLFRWICVMCQSCKMVSLVPCSMVAVLSVLSSATSNDCFVKCLTCFSSTYAVLPVHSSVSCPSLGEGVGDGHVTVT